MCSQFCGRLPASVQRALKYYYCDTTSIGLGTFAALCYCQSGKVAGGNSDDLV